MPQQNRRALVELLAQHRVPLIEDDVYAELHHGAEPVLPISSSGTSSSSLTRTRRRA